MNKKEVKKINEIIANIHAPGCTPRPNSEYHLGYQAAEVGYAEDKLRAMRKVEALLEQ